MPKYDFHYKSWHIPLLKYANHLIFCYTLLMFDSAWYMFSYFKSKRKYFWVILLPYENLGTFISLETVLDCAAKTFTKFSVINSDHWAIVLKGPRHDLRWFFFLYIFLYIKWFICVFWMIHQILNVRSQVTSEIHR